MAIPHRFELVPLAVGETQTFELMDGRHVMVVAVPAESVQHTATGGSGDESAEVSETKAEATHTGPLVPTLPGGHGVGIVVIDTTSGRQLEGLDLTEMLDDESLSLRFEPAENAEALPGIRIINDDLVQAALSAEPSEIVVSADEIREGG